MKTKTYSLGLVALLSTFAAPLTLFAAPDDVAVQVNDSAVSEREILQFGQMAGGRPPANANERQQAIGEITIQELWAQEALKNALDKDPDISARLSNARRDQLATAAVEHFQRENPISEEQLKARYQAWVEQLPKKEYKARHVLLKNREDALAVIAELDKGGDFAELAKERSTGPSAVRGGDLGWFTLTTMVKPFSDAVSSVKKGAYSKEPLQTQFGWHVIMLEDFRDKAPPAFEQVTLRMQLMMMQEAVQNHIAEMKKAAKIEVK